MIAEERRQLERRRSTAFVKRIGAEQLGKLVGAGALFATTSTTARANEKSSTLGSLSTRVFTAVCAGSMSPVATSPKIWKCGMPFAFARASIAGTNFCQNSGLTCCAVSMRKPSTSIFVDPVAKDVDHPADDARIFGEHVVEPEEIAHRAGFAAERLLPRLW